MERNIKTDVEENPVQIKKPRHPSWLRRTLPPARSLAAIQELTYSCGLSTVCREARCPNQGECYSNGTAAFLILGNTCTRNCSFCAVPHGIPVPEDKNEPDKVASAAQRLALSHVVVTSVTRDDLSDGGARQFATTIEAIRAVMPRSTVEVLIPDFQGAESALKLVIEARPDLLNHNLETVSRLYPKVRQGACYSRSLELFNRCRSINSDIPTKSGIMVGLGETWEELEQLFLDLVHVGCRALTIGQYLRPTSKHRSVKRFYSPEEFSQLELLARSIGIQEVCSGPLIRSSYGAAELLKQLTSNTD